MCDIDVEPLPEGSGFEFVEQGRRPRRAAKLHPERREVFGPRWRRVGAGYPVVDIRVTLFDGKAHSVDS